MSQAEQRWVVVVNDEEQYSVWRAGRTVPAGWRCVGVEGTEEHCLNHIEKVWTDMRPKSLREQMSRWNSAATEIPAAGGS